MQLVLHGAAGHGKSGVLYQFCQSQECGTRICLCDLIGRPPKDNPIAFGAKLWTPESPSIASVPFQVIRTAFWFGQLDAFVDFRSCDRGIRCK